MLICTDPLSIVVIECRLVTLLAGGVSSAVKSRPRLLVFRVWVGFSGDSVEKFQISSVKLIISLAPILRGRFKFTARSTIVVFLVCVVLQGDEVSIGAEVVDGMSKVIGVA